MATTLLLMDNTFMIKEHLYVSNDCGEYYVHIVQYEQIYKFLIITS